MDGDSNDKEKIDARLELLKLSVSRTKDLIGGIQFNGQALDENGKVCDGTFLLSGPISYFQEKNGPLSGLTQTGRDLKPRIFHLDNERNSAISAYFNLEADSEGILPIDSTLGDAVKVAAAEDTIIKHIQKGGTWAYPIVIAALIAFLISLMKYLQLSKITKPRNSAASTVIFDSANSNSYNVDPLLLDAISLDGVISPFPYDDTTSSNDSPALTGAVTSGLPTSITATTYRGAFAGSAATDNWMAGWTATGADSATSGSSPILIADGNNSSSSTSSTASGSSMMNKSTRYMWELEIHK